MMESMQLQWSHPAGATLPQVTLAESVLWRGEPL